MLKRIFLFVTIGMAFSSTALAASMPRPAYTGQMASRDIDHRGTQCSVSILKQLQASDSAPAKVHGGKAGNASGG